MALIEINRNSRKALEKLREDIYKRDDTISYFQERITELELALEDQDWQRVTGDIEGKEFSYDARQKVNRLARLYWLKNPLIKRAVYTQTSYVFGQGVSFEAEHDVVNEVVQDFVNDLKNRAELTDHQSLMTKETELQLFANIFFVFFHDPLTGRVRVRTLPVNEIEDVITDAEDSKTPLYYKRRYIEKSFDTVKGKYQRTEKVVYYPDWNNKNPVASIGGNRVSNDPVYHVKVNSLGDMKFGVSEIYAAQDWAKAYKGFLEDWATIAKSLAKFTWRAKTSGGKASIQNMKNKLDSSLKQQDTEKNPAPPAGSTFISGENQSLEPIKLAGVNMRAEDGDKMIHMVCAATGIFYHYLVGDPSTGNLATAKAMERPMEIMFRDRQIFWTSVFQNIFQYVIMKSIEAPNGKLNSYGSLVKNEWGEWIPQFKNDTENPDPEKRKKPISDTVNIEMPELLEKDTEKVVNSIINGATLGGRKPQGVISNEDLSRLLMMALGMENIDEKINELYPDDGEGQQGQNQGQEPNGGEDGEPNNNNSQAESQPDIIFRDAVKDMRDSLKEFVEYYNSKANGRQ